MLDDYGGELLDLCDEAGRRAHTVLIPNGACGYVRTLTHG